MVARSHKYWTTSSTTQSCHRQVDKQAECHRDWPLYDDVFHPPPLLLESRKPLWRDLQWIDVTSRWREDWQSATVVNSSLVVDPTIRLPGCDLHRRQWSLLNRFRTGQGHCNACYKKWGFTDNELCDCVETQTMSHIVNSCPSLTRSTALTWSRWGCRQLADNIWLLAHNNNNICENNFEIISLTITVTTEWYSLTLYKLQKSVLATIHAWNLQVSESTSGLYTLQRNTVSQNWSRNCLPITPDESAATN